MGPVFVLRPSPTHHLLDLRPSGPKFRTVSGKDRYTGLFDKLKRTEAKVDILPTVHTGSSIQFMLVRIFQGFVCLENGSFEYHSPIFGTPAPVKLIQSSGKIGFLNDTVRWTGVDTIPFPLPSPPSPRRRVLSRPEMTLVNYSKSKRGSECCRNVSSVAIGVKCSPFYLWVFVS